ncbi:hypothetical protein KDH_28920 [Dictyobacter sp. S3.2.2.5]|uniref:Integrase catalytic domain-containing protein n=2 Tax=Dictyobacter halimunensis TaxID=3026934 RepID=A0ABQ6FR44_9CHLR|nr:hypothetical protein KDH_28920 [Dictyobacter sp. S3.2.2.5]
MICYRAKESAREVTIMRNQQWTNYHRRTAALKTFHSYDHLLYLQLKVRKHSTLGYLSPMQFEIMKR